VAVDGGWKNVSDKIRVADCDDKNNADYKMGMTK